MIRRAVLSGTAAIALIAAGMVAVPGPALAADTATINGAATYQTMAGFGASEAFGQADTIMNGPAASDAAPAAFTLNGTACSL